MSLPRIVEVSIDYGQFSVALSTQQTPFPDWRPEHIAQGFALLPGAACFDVLRNTISLLLEIHLESESCGQVCESAIRAVMVPFDVPEGVGVAIVNISTFETLEVPPGEYTLQLEQWPGEDGIAHGRLLFCAKRRPAQVLRTDDDLTKTMDLLLTAELA